MRFLISSKCVKDRLLPGQFLQPQVELVLHDLIRTSTLNQYPPMPPYPDTSIYFPCGLTMKNRFMLAGESSFSS